MRGSRDSRERADRPVSPIGVASLGRSLGRAAISGRCRRAIRCRDRARVHAGGCEINVSAEAFSLGARTHLRRVGTRYLYRREPRGRASLANIYTSRGPSRFRSLSLSLLAPAPRSFLFISLSLYTAAPRPAKMCHEKRRALGT